MLGLARRDPRPARPRGHSPGRRCRSRRLRPEDVPRRRDVRSTDHVRNRRALPLRQRRGLDRRRKLTMAAKPEAEAARPGVATAARMARPTLILKVGRIWTGDRGHPWAEALAVRDGAIVAVGPAAEVMRFRGPSTRVIDRPDAFAMPGLIDAHGHMESLGASEEKVDLRGVASLDEVARRVKAWVDANPGRLVDHRAELGPEPLARGRIPDRGRARRGCASTARCGSIVSTAMPAGPTPRPCDERTSRNSPWRLPTARSSGTRKDCRPACSSTEPWPW